MPGRPSSAAIARSSARLVAARDTPRSRAGARANRTKLVPGRPRASAGRARPRRPRPVAAVRAAAGRAGSGRSRAPARVRGVLRVGDRLGADRAEEVRAQRGAGRPVVLERERLGIELAPFAAVERQRASARDQRERASRSFVGEPRELLERLGAQRRRDAGRRRRSRSRSRVRLGALAADRR